MKIFGMVLALCVLAMPVMAAEYVVDYGASAVTFTGTHAGQDFEGAFGAWDADIMFDAQDLAASKVRVTFDLASAKTGSKMYDGTLPQADWFDVKNTPEAVFESTAITAGEDDGYKVVGDFTIRGVTLPLSFDFNLMPNDDSSVRMQAAFVIDRLAYDIGAKSDGTAEWVSREIGVTLDIKAAAQ